jgi:hypothetical protein
MTRANFKDLMSAKKPEPKPSFTAELDKKIEAQIPPTAPDPPRPEPPIQLVRSQPELVERLVEKVAYFPPEPRNEEIQEPGNKGIQEPRKNIKPRNPGTGKPRNKGTQENKATIKISLDITPTLDEKMRLYKARHRRFFYDFLEEAMDLLIAQEPRKKGGAYKEHDDLHDPDLRNNEYYHLCRKAYVDLTGNQWGKRDDDYFREVMPDLEGVPLETVEWYMRLIVKDRGQDRKIVNFAYFRTSLPGRLETRPTRAQLKRKYEELARELAETHQLHHQPPSQQTDLVIHRCLQEGIEFNKQLWGEILKW